jgi:predicted  nucleic acid-binding Zn-ribbon protein
MSVESLVAVAVAVVSLGGSIFATVSARRTAREQANLERTKVDAEAFSRAKDIYSDAIKELERRTERLRRIIQTSEAEHRRLTQRVKELEQTISRLKVLCVAHNISVPDDISSL